jgi:histidyl-tRNA synthetase
MVRKKKSKSDFYPNDLKGFRSILPPKSAIYDNIRTESFEILKNNGYSQIIIPTCEEESVFINSIGRETDIIQKEMFTFLDRKKRKISLRPEGTSSVVKSVIKNGLLNIEFPLKLFYWGSMFRYERPQKGRYREFIQLGVEFINAPSLSSDCEILYLVNLLIDKLSLNDTKIFINYLGNQEKKAEYIEALQRFLKNDLDSLCAICKVRYYNNPLRIIDCKECGNSKLFPNYNKFLSQEELIYFEKIKKFLNDMKIDYSFDESLVRGISYYNGLVFEVRKSGSDKSLIGGGRYDMLFSKVNDSIKCGSIGFAMGVDRIIDFLEIKNNIIAGSVDTDLDSVFVCFSEETFFWAFSIKEKIRLLNKDLKIEIIFDEDRRKLKIINKMSTKFSLLFGEREIGNELIPVKNHIINDFFTIKKDLIVEWLINEIGKNRRNISNL